VIDISQKTKKIKRKRVLRKKMVRDSSSPKPTSELKSHDPFREKRNKRYVQSVRVGKGINWYFFKADMDALSLFFMLALCISLIPMLVNITDVDNIGLPAILLFTIQGVGSYALMRYVLIPILKKRSVLNEGIVYKSFMIILVIGSLMIFTGLYFRDSMFISTVSLPVFFLSTICLVGGVGIGINKSIFSVVTFGIAIVLLTVNAVIGFQIYSVFNSFIFALSALVYLELCSANDRFKNIEERITMKPTESDGQTLVDYKIDFLRGFIKSFSISSAILTALLLFPVLFRLITTSFSLDGYALQLTESVEMGTVYIYLLPSAIAVMLLVIYRMMRYAIRNAANDESNEEKSEVNYTKY